MFYVTLACNLRCHHCYVGNEWLDSAKYFDRQDAGDILHHFGSGGLDRLTILGGEPTLYPYLSQLVTQSRNYKIREMRMTTNAVDLKYFDMKTIVPGDFDHISISMDGHTRDIHESIRGPKSFDNTLGNLVRLLKKGFTIHVTYTVTGRNIDSIYEAVRFFNDLGVKEMNFHLVSMIGNAKNNLDLFVRPTVWRNVRRELRNLKNVRGMDLRVPLMYLTKEEYEAELDNGYKSFVYGSYHSDGGHRIIIYPNGMVYMSCDLTGTEFNFAYYDNRTFRLNRSRNEVSMQMEMPSLSDPSTQLLGKETEGYIPLSISYKELIKY